MASSIHVLEDIRDAIKYGLGTITTANGYNLTIPANGINSVPKAAPFPEYPAVNIFLGPEECANAVSPNHTQDGNRGLLHNSFDLILECWGMEANDPELWRFKILADLQKYFGNYYWLPDSGGNRTVFNMIYAGKNPFRVQQNNATLIGINVMFRVWYRQSSKDPSTLA
jgi:hypothetical protein